MIEKYLEDLEDRIEPSVEDDLLSEWKSFWNGNIEEDTFVPQRKDKDGDGMNVLWAYGHVAWRNYYVTQNEFTPWMPYYGAL